MSKLKSNIKQVVVWVFAIGLSGVLVDPVKALFRWIPWQTILSSESWNWLWVPRFSILSLLIWALCLLVILCIIKKIITKLNVSHKNSNSLEDYLKTVNYIIDEKAGIKVTWDVGIGSLYNNDPFPYNIRVFCLKHGEMPLLMSHGHCQDYNCENSQIFITESELKTQIESILLHAREEAIKAGYK